MLHSSELLPRSAPEAEGVSRDGLQAFLQEVSRTVKEMHSFVLVRNGSVVAESYAHPYHPALPHVLFSLSKSFTSTAAGFAVQEGLLSLNSPVISFFPDETPAHPSENLRSMRLRHLLSMATGHETEPGRGSQNWALEFLQAPVPFEPGTHFLYNSMATYMVANIVQKVTGQFLLDYLSSRLFRPLGIATASWETCPMGVAVGGWGLKLCTEDIAKLGLLYLQNGKWNNRQLLSPEWVETATSSHISNGSDPNNDWHQGYGFQFWRCRHNAYRGDGAFGQYCVVMPEQNAVAAITSGTQDMGTVLNLVWKHLLPAMADAAAGQQEGEPLRYPLTISAPQGEAVSETALKLEGKTVHFLHNPYGLETLHIESSKENIRIVISQRQKLHTIECDLQGQWLRSGTLYECREVQPIAATAAWSAPNTLEAKICYTLTPFTRMLCIQFEEEKVQFKCETNAGFGNDRLQEVIGIIR